MKKGTKILLLIVAIVTLLSLLVGAFEWAATPVAKALNKPVAVIQSIARAIAAVAIAAILVMAGLMSMAAAPFLGVVLIAIGILTAGLTLWPYLSSE